MSTKEQKLEAPVAVPAKGSEPLLRVNDVAALLCMSPGWVRDHATRKEPRLPAVKMGGKRGALRFRRESIEEFVRQLEVATNPIIQKLEAAEVDRSRR